ncbi:MAG: hypothetical protein RLZ55_1075 [Actinomycetota bacterium]
MAAAPTGSGDTWALLRADADRQLEAAAQLLAAGGLVALPTETVYGLAADAANPAAVDRVYSVKGRPAGHPLIVHLAEAAQAERWAARIPPALRVLAAEHWPGSLTLVVPKQAWVPDAITGGQDTVALRVPDQAATRSVIERLGALTGGPAGVVAPSANRFGAVSPTTAAHVVQGLGAYLGAGDAVLDAGPSPVGLESTIVDWDVATGALRVLRPGAVVLPRAGATAGGSAAAPSAPRVPGALAAHYAPRARVVLATAGQVREWARGGAGPGGARPPRAGRVGLLAPTPVPTPSGWTRLIRAPDDVEYARALYSALRAADDEGLDLVIAVPPSAGPLVAAVVDRLSRAAAGSARD